MRILDIFFATIATIVIGTLSVSALEWVRTFSAIGRLRFTLGPNGRAERFVLDAGRVQNLTFVRR